MHINQMTIHRHVRPIGWGLTIIAFLLATAWRVSFSSLVEQNDALLWVLVLGTVIIALSVIALSVKFNHNDLIIAGLLAFISPAVTLVIPSILHSILEGYL